MSEYILHPIAPRRSSKPDRRAYRIRNSSSARMHHQPTRNGHQGCSRSFGSSHCFLHDESGQNRDIEEYIKSVINTDKKNKRWKAADKQLVIDVLTRKAAGM